MAGPKSLSARAADPVSRYARAVARPSSPRQRIVAGRLVRLACERHLRDLDASQTKAFPWEFKARYAADCFDFFEQFLTLDDDSPFALASWVKFMLGSLEGWVSKTTGEQRFQVSYVETGKGTGKTPLGAAYGLYCLCGKDERSAEIYSLGVDAAQAAYMFKFAKRMAERSEDLRSVLDIGEHNIGWLARDSFFRPLAAEGRSLDNKRPYLALVDELHEHPSGVIPEKMRLGFKGRPNALLFEITNAGFDQTSVCWDHHEYTRQVLEGSIKGPAADRWFGYICQLDACDPCRDRGFSQPTDGCPQCDQWTDPAVWVKTNPSLGITMTSDQVQAVVFEALDRPSLQARAKRLYFCLWTQAHTVWIQSDKWDACAVPPAQLHTAGEGLSCAAGFDMSEKLDLTAAVVGLRILDAPGSRAPDELELVDTVDGETITRRLTLNFRVEIHPYFWLPEERLLERSRLESLPFVQWQKDGALRVTQGAVIDYDEIYDQFTTEIGPAFKPQRVGYDAHNASQFALALRNKGKYTVVDVPQGRALSESFKLFEALVRSRRLIHNGHPVMSWCVSNAAPKTDRYENLWLEKPSRAKRIDGVIAAVIMLHELVLLPERPYRKRGALVYRPGVDHFVPVGPPAPPQGGGV